MKNKFLIIILGIFLISFTSAGLIGPFKQGENISLIQTCSDCTYCKITSIQQPDGTILTFNENMQKDGTFYNWTLNSNYTTKAGTYLVNGIGDLALTDTVWTYDFDVTPTGIESTMSRTQTVSRSIWFLFAIAIILFVAFLFVKSSVPIKWTFFLISMMFFLQAISTLFVGMQDEVVNPKIEGYFSFLATSSFILFWFAFGILAVLWIITTIQTLLFKKTQRNLQRFGGE